MMQQMGDEAVTISGRLLKCLDVIFLVQFLLFLFDMNTLNLSILFFQFSLFVVGYLGASRFNTRLLKMYVGLRVTLWSLNFIFTLVYILYPGFCVAHLLPLFRIIPSEIIASHIHAWSTLEITLFSVFVQVISFVYSCIIVLSAVFACRLIAIVGAARALYPFEASLEASLDDVSQPQQPLKDMPLPVNYTPVSTVDIELQNHSEQYAMLATPQMPVEITYEAYPAPYTSALYPSIQLP